MSSCRTATATVLVNVTAVDEHYPECDAPYVIKNLLENSTINSLVSIEGREYDIDLQYIM